MGMLDSVRFPSWVHRLYLFSRATVNNARPRFCQKVYDKSSYFTTPDPIHVYKNHLHHEVVRSFLEWSCQISRMASSASLFTYAKVWRMDVVLYCRATPSPACQVSSCSGRWSPSQAKSPPLSAPPPQRSAPDWSRYRFTILAQGHWFE
jgi:hypothetical protein